MTILIYFFISCLPVEYIEVQSPVPFETSSSCGNSIPGSTANGILSSGNQIKTRSSVVCETRMERVELLVVKTLIYFGV